MTEGIYGVVPTGDRWDGQRILDTWCTLCKWMNTQYWDPENDLGVNCRQDNGRLSTGIVTQSVQYPVQRPILRKRPCVQDTWEMRPVRLIGTDRTISMLIGWTDIRTGGAVR